MLGSSDLSVWFLAFAFVFFAEKEHVIRPIRFGGPARSVGAGV